MLLVARYGIVMEREKNPLRAWLRISELTISTLACGPRAVRWHAGSWRLLGAGEAAAP